jgi:hypothetical protein
LLEPAAEGSAPIGIPPLCERLASLVSLVLFPCAESLEHVAIRGRRWLVGELPQPIR